MDKKSILKTLLASSTLLTLITTNPELVTAESVSFEVITDAELSQMNLTALEFSKSTEKSDKIIFTGIYEPNTEISISISDLEAILVTTKEDGTFELELETESLQNQKLQIMNINEEDLFLGTIIKEEIALPTLQLDKVSSQLLSGKAQAADYIQVLTTDDEKVKIPLTEVGTFEIRSEEYDFSTFQTIAAIDELGNTSEAIDLIPLLVKEDDEIVGEAKLEGEVEDKVDLEDAEPAEEELVEEAEQEIEKNHSEAATFSLFRAAPLNINGTKYHYVQSGETLNSIAKAYNTTVDNLQKWNSISNPSTIKVGELFSVNGKNVYDEIDKEKVTFSTPQSFIDYIAPYAEDIAEKYNLYTSVMIAQAIHESGWGKSDLAKLGNNLFGVKGTYNGNSVVMLTWEEIDGEVEWVQDSFRLYPRYYESIVDNAEKLRYGVTWDPTFYRGAWLENTASHFDVTEWLTGRYATDSQYATKINRIIANYNLTKYDKHINITNPVTSQKWINLLTTVTAENQSIYSQPKGTASDQLIDNTNNYLGKEVEIIQEKVNDLGTWWLIGQNGKEIGWVTQDSLSSTVYYRVTNTKDLNYTGTVVNPLSINTQPWGTKGSKQAVDVKDYMNRPVNITQEKMTDRATYVLISINGKELGWIDKSAIAENTDVKSTYDKQYVAIVKQPWSINTEPYGTHGYKYVKNADEYVGKTVEVSQEKVTERSTYSLISYNGETLGWIDKDAIEELKVSNTKNVRYIAQITQPWSINTQPWGIEGYREVGSGAEYLGQTLNVIQEQKTQRSTYLLLQSDGKTIGWIDEGAVSTAKDIKAERETRYAAKITNPWSINSQPWGTKGYKTVYADANQFIGRTVEVFKEQLTDRSIYALLSLNGKELGWMDITGIQKQEVKSTKNVNYQAEIAQPWSINSQPWGVEGFSENYASSEQFLGKTVTVKQEKVTPRSTYALIALEGQDLGWIDKGALNLYPILSTKETSYKATVTKPWSINTQPWGTNGFRTVVSDDSYVGRTVDIVQEKVTSRSTYGLIQVNGKDIGWIDLTGVEKLEVLSTKNTNYAVKVTKPWTINSQPWGVEGSEQVLDGASLVGDTFIVTQEKTTPRSTYVLLTRDGEELGWIDVTGIEKQVVTNTKDVYYTAKVTKPWSINTQPWGVEGFRAIPNASSHVGGTYDIIQEKVTKRGTYGLLSKTGQTIGWIDLTGVERDRTVKSMRRVNYTAELVNPWSINTEPWGTKGAKVIHSSSYHLLGETVRVTAEKVTDRSTYALIALGNQTIGWIDITALKK